MMNKKLTLVIILVLKFCIVNAQSDSAQVEKDKLLEFSFGKTILFISESKVVNMHQKAAVVIPTNTSLIFIEFRPLKKISYPLYVNIPTGSKQFLVNGVLINEKVNPDFGFGAQFRLINAVIDKKTSFDFKGGVLANFIFPKANPVKFSPALAGRMRFVKQKDFAMYIGPTYAIGIRAWGLIFGTGYIF